MLSLSLIHICLQIISVPQLKDEELPDYPRMIKAAPKVDVYKRQVYVPVNHRAVVEVFIAKQSKPMQADLICLLLDQYNLLRQEFSQQCAERQYLGWVKKEPRRPDRLRGPIAKGLPQIRGYHAIPTLHKTLSSPRQDFGPAHPGEARQPFESWHG